MKLLEIQSKTGSSRKNSQKAIVILQERDGNGLDEGSAEKTEVDLRQIFFFFFYIQFPSHTSHTLFI